MKTALLPPLSSNTNKNSSLLPRRPSTSNASLSSRSPSSNSRGIRLPPHSSSTATISTPSRQSSLKIKDPSPRVVEPAPIYHEPILLLEHYKIFWRIHQTALISIYFHLDCDFFEVIAYFVDKLREERLYVSNKSIIPIFENTSEMQMVKFLRWDLLDRSLRKCAAEYIFGIIDSDSFGYLCLTKYAVAHNDLLDLHIPPPANLIPVSIKRNPIRSSAEILQEITELSHDIPTITETATQFSVSTETQLESLSNLDHHFKTESTINPNLYTPARWRWVWSIDKVLASLRVQKVINKIWRSANKGHLVYQTMTLDEQKRMLTNGRFPLFQSFRKYSTTISARQPQSAHMQTPVIIQPPPSIFHELISSFEDSKNKAKERRKSRILSPLHASNCSKNI